MGSGDRFTYGLSGGFGLGLNFSRFPFALTISLAALFWYVSIGFGKAYDE